jgi:hypothetical protein
MQKTLKIPVVERTSTEVGTAATADTLATASTPGTSTTVKATTAAGPPATAETITTAGTQGKPTAAITSATGYEESVARAEAANYYGTLLATSGMLTAIGTPATATPSTASSCRSGGLRNIVFLLTNQMKNEKLGNINF